MKSSAEHHRARRLALQGLSSLDVQGPGVLDLAVEFIRESRETPGALAEAEEMLQQAFAVRQRADALLAGESQHWEVGRMALVDRNILRLALWELLAGATPKKVVIAEAIRLAQEFSTAESARFINGVLDAAARRIQEHLRRDAGDAGDERNQEEETTAAAEEEEEGDGKGAGAE